MARAELAWGNLADSGIWTASGFVVRCPPATLQNKHVARKWRVNASTAHLVCDLQDQYDIDWAALVGLNRGTQPTRVRISDSDSSGEDGSEYDSGALSSPWNPNYLPFVHRIESGVVGRYIRYDLATSAPYIECGRGVAAESHSFEVNFAPGWNRTIVDPSIRTIGRGGQSFDDLREKYRRLELSFQYMTETERWELAEEVDLVLGQSGDMLVVTDPDSSDLSRDSIWGFNETINPVVEPVFIKNNRRFQRTFTIRERQ